MATTYYVTQAGAGAANGTSLANAWSLASFNSSSSPTGVDAVVFDGTISGQVVCGSSGTSTVIQLLLDMRTATLTYAAASPRISLSTRNYIKILGGAHGVIDHHCVGGAGNAHSGITISGLTYTGPSGGTAAVLADGYYDNLLIDACTLDNCTLLFSDTTANHDMIFRNTYCRGSIDTTQQYDILQLGDAYNVTIEGCYLENRAPGNPANSRHNDILQNFESGHSPHAKPHGWIIRHNKLVVSQSDGSGGNMSVTIFENMTGSPGLEMYGNIIYGNAVSWAGGNGVTVSINDPTLVVKFYNNTICKHASPINPLRLGFNAFSDGGTLDMRNNAILCDSADTIETTMTASPSFDYNFFKNLSSASGTPAIASLYGAHGSGSLTSGAFTDSANNDFTTVPGSVLRGTGVTLSSPYDQGIAFAATWPNPALVTRTAGNFDIGAYQFIASSGAPTLTSATINSAGTAITLTFNIAVAFGTGGNAGWTSSLTGGAATLTYSSGTGTASLVYSLNRTISAGETGTVSYTQPGNGVESTADQTDLATLSGASVINNSTQGSVINSTTVNFTTLNFG